MILSKFNNLRWRLTLSYTIVTTLVLLVTSSIFQIAPLLYLENSKALDEDITLRFQENVSYLENAFEPNNASALEAWIDQVWQDGFLLESSPLDGETGFSIMSPIFCISIINNNAEILASRKNNLFENDEPCYAENKKIGLALAPNRGGAYEVDSEEKTLSSTVIFPIKNKTNLPAYVIFEVAIPPSNFFVQLQLILQNIILALITSAIIGIAFGYIASHGVVNRIVKLMSASEDWARGQLGTQVIDHRGDEIAQLARTMNNMASQLTILLAKKEKFVRAEERRLIAADLHDTIKQNLFLSGMQLSTLKILLHKDTDDSDELIDKILVLNQKMKNDLVDVTRASMLDAFEQDGLIDGLKKYIEEFESSSNISVMFLVASSIDVPLKIEMITYRVAVEALRNIAKHSGAQAAHISIAMLEKNLIVEIIDDGNGFDFSASTTGVGLMGIKQRVSSVSGTFDITSSHRGTRLKLMLPADQNPAGTELHEE